MENEVPFNFDLEQMKDKVESETIIKPEGLKGEELTEWLLSEQTEYKTQCDEILLSRGMTHNGGHYKFKNIEDFMELYHQKVKEIKEDNKQ